MNRSSVEDLDGSRVPTPLNTRVLYQADAASDKELRDALQIKLDRMKDECDKLAAQLSVEEESRSLLQRKQQLLKQQLEDRVSPAS